MSPALSTWLVVLRALVSMGCTVQHGAAPPGPLERSIVRALVSIGEFHGR